MDQTNGFSCEAIEKALLETTTCLLDDMLSTPLAPQIMQQRHPPRFTVPKFTIYDGTTDLFDHLMHYCQPLEANHTKLKANFAAAKSQGACCEISLWLRNGDLQLAKFLSPSCMPAKST
ncbi:hypothetical protein CK203_048878 [Vitis vinifera]|uniref:Uncharacterized protein n=1 Tax=Vitis vinifera TaxID=29760 RepID=A0A438FL06_VITVI|nr:hypothetical protein CK203_048878 [Vitis vinifera]